MNRPISYAETKVIRSVDAMHSYCIDNQNKGISIGFVPTMGNLHQGHISLIEKARQENDVCVCSIFVNPTQFNDPKDLNAYPRTLKNDLDMLQQNNCAVAFVPETASMYTEGIKSKQYNFNKLDEPMEGLHRPGHFNGMATIVEKLLTIVVANKAYFGEKDYQQLLLVKKLCEIESLPTQIIACPIVREKNGLAMSSRNNLLNDAQKQKASILYNSLMYVKDYFKKFPVLELQHWVKDTLSKTIDINLEYFEIVNQETLEPVAYFNDNIKARAFIAAKINGVRLIDNLALY